MSPVLNFPVGFVAWCKCLRMTGICFFFFKVNSNCTISHQNANIQKQSFGYRFSSLLWKVSWLLCLYLLPPVFLTSPLIITIITKLTAQFETDQRDHRKITSVFILFHKISFQTEDSKFWLESITLAGMWKALMMNWFLLPRNLSNSQIDLFSERSKLLFLLQRKILSMSLAYRRISLHSERNDFNASYKL